MQALNVAPQQPPPRKHCSAEGTPLVSGSPVLDGDHRVRQAFVQVAAVQDVAERVVKSDFAIATLGMHGEFMSEQLTATFHDSLADLADTVQLMHSNDVSHQVLVLAHLFAADYTLMSVGGTKFWCFTQHIHQLSNFH